MNNYIDHLLILDETTNNWTKRSQDLGAKSEKIARWSSNVIHDNKEKYNKLSQSMKNAADKDYNSRLRKAKSANGPEHMSYPLNKFNHDVRTLNKVNMAYSK